VAAIDLNADVGEECGDDAALLEVVTTANVAAGGHSGGGEVLTETVTCCAACNVAVGAHPSYPDRENFGRLSRKHAFSTANLTALIREQVLDVAAACDASGTRLTHVKAHGALYHDIASDPDAANAFLTAVLHASTDIGRDVYVTGSPTSQLRSAAQARDVFFVAEAFIDRLYNPDGTLVSRSHPHAVHRDLQAVLDQATSIVMDARVRASDGSIIDLQAQTVCVHGDTPGAVEMARAVREYLTDNGITISAITPGS
jgi:UPF0271 protein